MLKEVGTSGQISLGKKFAGQLFDLAVHEDGSIVMKPVKVVPAKPEPEPASTSASTTTREWANAHASDIEQYNAWASKREPYSQRVRRWRESGL
jgi:hypothetical protein